MDRDISAGQIGSATAISRLRVGADIRADEVRLGDGRIAFGADDRTVTGDLAAEVGANGTVDIGTCAHAISGDLALSAGDMLRVRLDGASGAGTIAVAGTATISAGSRLAIDLSSASAVAQEASFTLVDGGGATTIDAIPTGNIYVTASRARRPPRTWHLGAGLRRDRRPERYRWRLRLRRDDLWARPRRRCGGRRRLDARSRRCLLGDGVRRAVRPEGDRGRGIPGKRLHVARRRPVLRRRHDRRGLRPVRQGSACCPPSAWSRGTGSMGRPSSRNSPAGPPSPRSTGSTSFRSSASNAPITVSTAPPRAVPAP